MGDGFEMNNISAIFELLLNTEMMLQAAVFILCQVRPIVDNKIPSLLELWWAGNELTNLKC